MEFYIPSKEDNLDNGGQYFQRLYGNDSKTIGSKNNLDDAVEEKNKERKGFR